MFMCAQLRSRYQASSLSRKSQYIKAFANVIEGSYILLLFFHSFSLSSPILLY